MTKLSVIYILLHIRKSYFIRFFVCFQNGQKPSVSECNHKLAVVAIKHKMGISNNRAEGFGGLFMSKFFPYMASKCPENALKWTAKPTIFAIRYLARYLVRYVVRYLVRHLVRYQMVSQISLNSEFIFFFWSFRDHFLSF